MQDEKTHATAKRLLEDIGYEGTCAARSIETNCLVWGWQPFEKGMGRWGVGKSPCSRSVHVPMPLLYRDWGIKLGDAQHPHSNVTQGVPGTSPRPPQPNPDPSEQPPNEIYLLTWHRSHFGSCFFGYCGLISRDGVYLV